MVSIWEACGDDLADVKCDWCMEETEGLKKINEEAVCVECLKKEEFEPEPTWEELARERNS